MTGPAAGAVLLHGFGGDPSCMTPFADALRPRLSRVVAPVLSGHGGEWTDLRPVRWPDWCRDASEAVAEAAGAGPVAIIGVSMGGALALRVAAMRPEVSHVVLINPALRLELPLLPLIPVVKWVVPSVVNRPAQVQVLDPAVRYRPYPRFPLGSVLELARLQADARRRLPAVTQPILVFRSLPDGELTVRQVAIVRAGVRSAAVEEVTLAYSGHIATLDPDAPEIFERTAAFLGASD